MRKERSSACESDREKSVGAFRVGRNVAVAALAFVLAAGCRGRAPLSGPQRDVHLGMAAVQSRYGDAEAALKLYGAAFGRGADKPYARLRLAQAHYRAGRFEEAEILFRGLLDDDPDSPVVLFDLGKTLFRLHRVEESAILTERLVRLHGATLPVLCAEALRMNDSVEGNL